MEISFLQCVREGTSSSSSTASSTSESDYNKEEKFLLDEKNRLQFVGATRSCGLPKREMGRFHITPHLFT